MKRRLAREIALQVIYQWDVGKNDLENALTDRITEIEPSKKITSFAQELARGTVSNIESIDQNIEKYLKEWTLERIASIDRNILRLALFELLFVEEIPDKVAINEALELTKIFSAPESVGFINGVLDNVYQSKKHD